MPSERAQQTLHSLRLKPEVEQLEMIDIAFEHVERATAKERDEIIKALCEALVCARNELRGLGYKNSHGLMELIEAALSAAGWKTEISK